MTNPEHESKQDAPENEPTFTDRLSRLLTGIEFEETSDILEARTAVVEALTGSNQDPDFLRSVWEEYATVCEQAVDSRTQGDTDPQHRAGLQIATLIHKALIFREIGDTQRYGEDLVDAEEYAYNMQFDEVSDAINTELDSLQNGE